MDRGLGGRAWPALIAYVSDGLDELQVGNQAKRSHLLVEVLCGHRRLAVSPVGEQGLDQIVSPLVKVWHDKVALAHGLVLCRLLLVATRLTRSSTLLPLVTLMVPLLKHVGVQ